MKKLLIIALLLVVLMPADAKRTRKSSVSKPKVETIVKDSLQNQDDVAVAVEMDGMSDELSDTIPFDEYVIDEDLVDSDNLDEEYDEYNDETDIKWDGSAEKTFENIFGGSLQGLLTILSLFIILPLIIMVVLPIVIIGMIIGYKKSKQKERNELIKALAASGQDVSRFFEEGNNAQRHPAGYAQQFTANKQQSTTSSHSTVQTTSSASKNNKILPSYKKTHDRGVTNIIIGGIIALVCVAYHWPSLFTLGGLILCGVGASQIYRAKRDSQDEQEANSASSTNQDSSVKNDEPSEPVKYTKSEPVQPTESESSQDTAPEAKPEE